jgi:hypothetical protein
MYILLRLERTERGGSVVRILANTRYGMRGKEREGM